QQPVPILLEDDAREVFAKVTVAAEIVLARSLPGLIAGTAPRRPQPVEPGQYFGRRRPEDGRIDWTRPALEIHNLVRAVAPPFPGAFGIVGAERWEIHRTRLTERRAPGRGARLFGADGECYAACGAGAMLRPPVQRTASGYRAPRLRGGRALLRSRALAGRGGPGERAVDPARAHARPRSVHGDLRPPARRARRSRLAGQSPRAGSRGRARLP